MTFILLLIILLVFVNLGYVENVYYVRPKSLSSCSSSVQLCYTLEEYAVLQSKYINTGSTILFLPGNHYTNISLQLINVSHVTLKGITVDFVLPKVDVAIHCENVQNLTIQSLIIAFTGYRHGIMSVLTITNSKMLSFSDMIFFTNSSSTIGHLNRAISFNHSSATIKNCTFRDHNASIGGAILISDGSNINLNEIVFVRNTANKGGAIYALESNVWIYGPTLFNSNHGAEGGGIFCQMCTLSGLGEIKFRHNFASRTG